MKRIIILSIIILCVISGLSKTIQELGSSPFKLLAYSSELNEEKVENILEKVPYKRLFLVDFNDRKICALLLEEADLTFYSVKNFEVVEDIEAEKAVMIYLQIQRSLFDNSNLTNKFSYNTLLLDDMSYIDYFLKNLSEEKQVKNNIFKEHTHADVITGYLKNYNKLLNTFYNNFHRYLNQQTVDIKPTVYEEEKEKIPAAGYDFLSREIKGYYSQIELLSLLMWYKDYQKTIYKQSGITFTHTPWQNCFKEDVVENAVRFQMNLDFLEYAAKNIEEDLNRLNQEFSKSYGVMNIGSLESLLLKNTIFEIIVLEVLEHLRKDATTKTKSDALQILINRKQDYENVDDYIDSIIDNLKVNVIRSASVLSSQENAYRMYKALNNTEKQKLTVVKEGLISKSYNTIELIKTLEIDQRNVHFAVVDSTVTLSSDQPEKFTKVYPIFPANSTKDKPIILLDFFNTAANHLTRTVLLALRTIILNGFSLKQLEAELHAENVTIEINEFLKMEPFHELYRMVPTSGKRLITQIENANIGYLALDDLFAGNIPKAILNEIEKLASTEAYKLARYPVEFYSEDTTVNSVLPRKEKAIVFVHGKQNIPYFDDNSEILPQIEAVWRNQGRMDVWNGFYEFVNENPEQFKEYDFYEFTYDTSVLTAKEYGKVLSEILFKNSIHTTYDQIHMVASSMGGLVSRECLNHSYQLEENQTPLFFGDYIKELITLDTPHLGTIAQNFILSVNPALMKAVLEVKSDNPPNIELTLGSFIASFVNDTESVKSAELMIYFARNHPEMVGKLFTEMLRFLDPFPGGMCMLYAPQDYCESLGIYLYSETKNTDFEAIFVSDPPTNHLNEKDAYLDKLFLVSAELTDQSTDITQGLSITYNLMEIIGEKLSHQTMDNLSRHGRNDGVVNLYSQQMWGIDKGQQRHHFMNLDHLAIPRSKDVVKFIMEERILK